MPFVDTPLTSNVREAVERDWSTNLNGPAVRLYGGEESAAFRVGDVVIRIGPAWRQLAELEWCHAVATAAAASVREAIAPRVNTRGETVGLVDGRPVSVWPFIEGQWAADDDEQQCSQAPVLLAAIHRALEGATVGPRPVRSAPSTFVPEVEDPELDKWLGDFLKSHPHHQPLHGDFYAWQPPGQGPASRRGAGLGRGVRRPAGDGARMGRTLLAAISDTTHPDWRAAALGVYRFWRDSGRPGR